LLRKKRVRDANMLL